MDLLVPVDEKPTISGLGHGPDPAQVADFVVTFVAYDGEPVLG
jgi:hypothetical protein